MYNYYTDLKIKARGSPRAVHLRRGARRARRIRTRLHGTLPRAHPHGSRRRRRLRLRPALRARRLRPNLCRARARGEERDLAPRPGVGAGAQPAGRMSHGRWRLRTAFRARRRTEATGADHA